MKNDIFYLLKKDRSPLENQAALKQLYDLFYEKISIFSKRITKSGIVSQDITSECFIKLWENRNDFYSIYQAQAFLYRTARNKAIDHLRHMAVASKSHQELLFLAEQEQVIQYHGINAEVWGEMLRAIKALPSPCREVCELTIFENLSTSEIAAKLGIGITNVSNQKAKARGLLQSSLMKKELLLTLPIYLQVLNITLQALSKN